MEAEGEGEGVGVSAHSLAGGPSGAEHRLRLGGVGMLDRFTQVAESLVHARPASEAEAIAALEWIAARKGKGLDELMKEQAQLALVS
jgi:hypothetical protein